jgi:hypothetical protein
MLILFEKPTQRSEEYKRTTRPKARARERRVKSEQEQAQVEESALIKQENNNKDGQ